MKKILTSNISEIYGYPFAQRNDQMRKIVFDWYTKFTPTKNFKAIKPILL